MTTRHMAIRDEQEIRAEPSGSSTQPSFAESSEVLSSAKSSGPASSSLRVVAVVPAPTPLAMSYAEPIESTGMAAPFETPISPMLNPRPETNTTSVLVELVGSISSPAPLLGGTQATMSSSSFTRSDTVSPSLVFPTEVITSTTPSQSPSKTSSDSARSETSSSHFAITPTSDSSLSFPTFHATSTPLGSQSLSSGFLPSISPTYTPSYIYVLPSQGFSTPTTIPQQLPSKGSDGPDTAVIVGAVIAGLVTFVALVTACFYRDVRKLRRLVDLEGVENAEPSVGSSSVSSPPYQGYHAEYQQMRGSSIVSIVASSSLSTARRLEAYSTLSQTTSQRPLNEDSPMEDSEGEVASSADTESILEVRQSRAELSHANAPSISCQSDITGMTDPPPPYGPGEPFNPDNFDLSQVTIRGR